MLYTLEFNNGWLKVPDALARAEHFATLALAKDPDEPMAYNAAAVVGIYVGAFRRRATTACARWNSTRVLPTVTERWGTS